MDDNEIEEIEEVEEINISDFPDDLYYHILAATNITINNSIHLNGLQLLWEELHNEKKG